jgi:hypothetical protein
MGGDNETADWPGNPETETVEFGKTWATRIPETDSWSAWDTNGSGTWATDAAWICAAGSCGRTAANAWYSPASASYGAFWTETPDA